jgi:hypothetical protein
MAGLFLMSAGAAEPARSTASADWARKEVQARLYDIEGRARQVYPGRRDTPLRLLNITDEEVREVQAIAREYEMPELMNISPVVTGCPCEEGGSCTEQVYIVSRIGERTRGLQLSRHQNLWTVGAVQKWWLEYASLLARARDMSYFEFQELRALKLLEFPVCTKPGNTPPQIAETSPKQ